MMKPTAEMNAHVAASVSVMLLLWIVVMILLWRSDSLHIVLKVLLTPVSFVACGYIGHRLIPRVTGPVVEAIFRNPKKTGSQQDKSSGPPNVGR